MLRAPRGDSPCTYGFMHLPLSLATEMGKGAAAVAGSSGSVSSAYDSYLILDLLDFLERRHLGATRMPLQARRVFTGVRGVRSTDWQAA